MCVKVVDVKSSFWMSSLCCFLSVVSISAVNTVIQYMPLIFLLEAEKSVGDVGEGLCFCEDRFRPPIAEHFESVYQLRGCPGTHESTIHLREEGKCGCSPGTQCRGLIEQGLRLSPRQQYTGWVYPMESPLCHSTTRGYRCEEAGVYSSIFVINGTQEHEVGWGRGSEDPDEIKGNALTLSESIAHTLGLVEGQKVIVKIQLE